MLGDGLTSDDLAAVDEVIMKLGAGRSTIAVASGRAIWVAVRPEVAA